MKLPQDDSKFTSQWKYTEVGLYLDSRNQLVRYQSYKKSILLDGDEVEEYRKRYNNVGIYTSIWNYNDRDIDAATRLGPLYFDLDSSEIGTSYGDAVKLYNYLRESIPDDAIRVYFTGRKGFHIECEPIALGISASNELPGLFRFIAQELKELLSLSTIDFAVYDVRRMWRLPNSKHQLSGLYKVSVDLSSLDAILERAREPHFEDVVPEQVFDYKANAWYREWGYKEHELRTLSLQDRINRFNKLGSTIIRKANDSELLFDPESLLTNCHAINDIWTKAETTHDLLHEERLFLCSILTYTEDAQEYLHAILRECNDYNESKSQAHIDDWIRRRELGIGGRPYSCQRANAAGVGCGDCHLEAREKVIKVGGNWVATGEEAQPSPIRYGYYKKRSH